MDRKQLDRDKRALLVAEGSSMSPRGGHRPGAGRKPVNDPRVVFPVRVRMSILAACELCADMAGVSLRDWLEAKLRKAAGMARGRK